MWPLAPHRRPGSEQRAAVVITEGLIADRTFQQPVVNWMEAGGGSLCRCTSLTDALLMTRTLRAKMSFSLFESCKKQQTVNFPSVCDTMWRRGGEISQMRCKSALIPSVKTLSFLSPK